MGSCSIVEQSVLHRLHWEIVGEPWSKPGLSKAQEIVSVWLWEHTRMNTTFEDTWVLNNILVLEGGMIHRQLFILSSHFVPCCFSPRIWHRACVLLFLVGTCKVANKPVKRGRGWVCPKRPWADVGDSSPHIVWSVLERETGLRQTKCGLLSLCLLVKHQGWAHPIKSRLR